MPALRTAGAIRLLGVLAAGGWVTQAHPDADYTLYNYVGQPVSWPLLRSAILACERAGQIAGDGSGALTLTAQGRADWARVAAAREGKT